MLLINWGHQLLVAFRLSLRSDFPKLSSLVLFLPCFNNIIVLTCQYSSPTQQRWWDRWGTRGLFSYSSFGTCQYSSRSGAAGLAVLLLQRVVVFCCCWSRCSWKCQGSEALKWSHKRSCLSRNRRAVFPPLIYANMSVVITLVNSMFE